MNELPIQMDDHRLRKVGICAYNLVQVDVQILAHMLVLVPGESLN